ncbi:diaminopimelate epimerase [soil metagenome]
MPENWINGDVPFWKMNGSGNDFIVVDNRTVQIPEDYIATWAKRVCRRRESIGADGVVMIDGLEADSPSGVAFRWRYFNADGSEGEMCGNGAMCGARFAIDERIAPNPCSFTTMSGVVEASLTSDSMGSMVSLSIPDTGPMTPEFSIEVRGTSIACRSVNVGVPHTVVVVDDADAWPDDGEFEAWGLAIRQHSNFAPSGANVNIVSQTTDGRLRMRTYERGVESETLACGTGAVASALVATEIGLMLSPVHVATSGGRNLVVDFLIENSCATSVRLIGTASVVAKGQMRPDDVQW